MGHPIDWEDRDDLENMDMSPDQLDEELSAPEDQTGLVGDVRSADESGLVGTPESPDNTGLLGSTGAPYGGDPRDAGGYDSVVEDLGGDLGGSGQTRTPETELLDPDYNPRLGNAGTLDDLNRSGHPGMPDYQRDEEDETWQS